MSRQNPCPTESEGAKVHRLGALEFDRADLVYYAACSCGHRFGPLATVPSLQATFERHRGSVEAPPDPPGV